MPDRIGALIQTFVRGTQAQREPLFGIQRSWSELVGEGLAAHSRPVGFIKGKLLIHVDHPGDGFEMSYRAPALIRRLKEQTRGRVAEIVIRAARVGASQRAGHGLPD
jgi:hypothetical protein